VRVVVADKEVKDHRVQHPRQVEDRRAGDLTQQSETLFERRPTFLLILVLGDDAQCLAEVLLMQAFKRYAFWTLAVRPVVTFDQQVFNVFYTPDFSFCHWQANHRSESHAVGFVENDSGEPLHGGLQNMRAWRAAQGERDGIALHAHCDLVLCTGKRKANAGLASQQRTARQFPENPRQLRRGKRSVVVVRRGQGFASGKERDSARALPADPFQHRVIVASTDAQVAGDDLALALLRQNTGEVAPAFLAREALPPQRQRVGQRRGVGPLQPALRVVKDHLAAVILDEMADQLAVQVNIQGSRHALLLTLGDRRRRQSDPDSQGLQDSENLANLAGFLAFFEFNNEAQPRTGGQRQVLLRDAQPFSALPDNLADLLC